MLVFLNGEFVPEEQATISVFDRGFLYGDGLFETLRIFGGRPFRLNQHVARLRMGTELLGIPFARSNSELADLTTELVRRNARSDGVLRMTLSRGVGLRGYSQRGAERPTFMLSLHPAPEFDPASSLPAKLVTSSLTLNPHGPLAAFKTANKLIQILARAEAERSGADEAVLLDSQGNVAQATASNIFWIERDSIFTSSLSNGVLPGVTREIVFEICASAGIALRDADARVETLRGADGVFLTNSVNGIVEAGSLDGAALRTSSIVARLQSAYNALVRAETSELAPF